MTYSPLNWVGRRRGRLTVHLELSDRVLIVDCDCGKRKTIHKNSFYHALSCGCLKQERASEGMKRYWQTRKRKTENQV